MTDTEARTIDDLMEHLRNSGIDIKGNKEKKQLINYGYYHGYKGYRCFQSSFSGTPIPFTKFEEIVATIEYDTELKTILYPKLMFVETALESVTCQKIVEITGSTTFNSMMNSAIENFNRCDSLLSTRLKRAKQKEYFNLKRQLEGSIAKAYETKVPKITHYIESPVLELPIWALFEILTLGEV